MQKPSATLVTAAIAVAITLSIFGFLRWRAATQPIEAGFWFEDFPFALPEEQSARIGGPLIPSDLTTIKQIATQEVERAFSGLRIVVTDKRDAFWRVRVIEDIGPGSVMRSTGMRAGESYALGPLGGAGSVSFLVVAQGAIHHAPTAASREDIIAGIGRGIGRTAAHEFGHAILGGKFDGTDEKSYEYESPDRVAQYYDELHWATAWPRLKDRFGK